MEYAIEYGSTNVSDTLLVVYITYVSMYVSIVINDGDTILSVSTGSLRSLSERFESLSRLLR